MTFTPTRAAVLLLATSLAVAAYLLRPLGSGHGKEGRRTVRAARERRRGEQREEGENKEKGSENSFSSAKETSSSSNNNNVPKYYIASYLNYTFALLTVSSIVVFLTDSGGSSSRRRAATAVWGVCVSYFLGFSGIGVVGSERGREGGMEQGKVKLFKKGKHKK